MKSRFPTVRMRRLRKTETLRRLVRETTISVDDLIYPLFVEEGIDKPLPISSMPGINRIPEQHLGAEIKALQSEGLRAVMLFGVSHNKDATGTDSWKGDGLLSRMVKRAKDAAPDMAVIADVCFCEYTDHGHCGVIEDGHVHNDTTIGNLGRQAVAAAQAGVDMVAPSSMMDGQVKAIREALDDAGHVDLPIMAYSSIFASAFYGPVRAAAGC
ncbi:MAG: porphobilinogen synthase, partial [Bdellovibrionales bacterium]